MKRWRQAARSRGFAWLTRPAATDAVPGNSQQVVLIRRRAPGCIPGRRAHRSAFGTRHGRARRRIGGEGGDREVRHRRHAPVFRRARREGLRLEAGARRQAVLRGHRPFISYHPHFANTAIWDTQCGSYRSVVLTFETTAPERWIDKSLIPTTRTSHAAARCPGAIDDLSDVHNNQIHQGGDIPHTAPGP